MKEETIEKTVEVADKAIDVLGGKMVDYLTGVENIISQYGGDAANLALNVLRIEAISGALLTLCVAVIFIFSFKYLYKILKDEVTEKNFPFVIISGLSTLVSFLIMIEEGSIWHWVGMFYPEMYAVHKFIM